ncbi:MAG: hypothetical protein ACLKAK_09070 [Alkaliphilus sp.]
MNISFNEFTVILLAAVQATPGIGTTVGMADFAVNASLAAAELFNTRQSFRNVRRNM